LTDLVNRRRFLTLKDIVELASVWQTSATSAAIRYAEFTSEPCAVILSEDGKVCYYIPSEDAAYRGFQWLGRKAIPPGTATSLAAGQEGSAQVFEQASDTETWFSQRKVSYELWEEAFPLGYTGLVLTMLAFEVPDEDDED
jgi:hypothetical protein